MTKLSFRVAETEAAETEHWAELLGVDKSQLLRDALHGHLARLEAQQHAHVWAADESSLSQTGRLVTAAWGPAEDWSDWDEATG
jgi:hypothetical protein